MNRIPSIIKTIIVLVLVLSFSCDHKFENPFDPDTEIKNNEWAPDSLIVMMLDDSHIRLTWTQEESRIEGFIIERKDDYSDYKEVERTDTTLFLDDSLMINIGYFYRIMAFAGNNLDISKS